MKKCFECVPWSCKYICTGVHVLGAIDFYNSDPQVGDVIVSRSDKREYIIVGWDEYGRARVEAPVAGVAFVCYFKVKKNDKVL